MALSSALRLVCASLLLVGGVRPEPILFSRAGGEVTLPCDSLKHLGPFCSDVNWLYNKDTDSSTVFKVSKGKVVKSEASRLTRNSDCSLHLHNVTESDSGRFMCRYRDSTDGTLVLLNVLTVFQAPPDSSSNVMLECRLHRYDWSCRSGTFRWLDQTKTSLPGDQRNCMSYLTVESPDSGTFTCQYEENREVKVSAEFRLEGKRETPAADSQRNMTTGWWFLGLKAVGWGALICAAVVVSIYSRKKEKPKRSSGVFDMVICPVASPGNTAPAADYENQK